uniref:Tyrosine specific protein phosphatases domain-containing protein n=2 Tax=Alexandrium monilatum TaxID=311494 RepID=A0A7S4SZZ7_9DINO
MVKDDVEMKAACASYTHQSHRYDCSWIVPGRLMVGADPVTVICDPNPATCNSLLPDGDSTALPSPEDEDDSDLELASVDTVSRDFSGYVSMVSSYPAGYLEDLDYASFLRASGVGLVLRANFDREKGMPAKSYSDDAFEPYGIRHANIRVVDEQGGLPEKKDLARAFEAAKDFWDQDPNRAVFVHCKGGFGRSVIFTCCLAIERFNISGRALLGWVHIARPGAFTTRKQQLFLIDLKGREDVRRAAGLRSDCVESETKATPSCTGCAVQ